MNWGYLYTSLEGRISRKPYWLATLLMIALCAPVQFFLLWAAGPSIPILFGLLLIYPSFALAVKRAHDRGRPTGLIVAFFGLVILLNVIQLLGVGGWPGAARVLFLTVSALWFAAMIFFIIDLGFFRGTRGPNRYGPDPLA